MKKLCWLLVLLVVPFVHADVASNVSINYTQLPYVTTYVLNLTLQENATISFFRSDNESLLNVSFPESVFLNASNNASVNITTTVLQHNVSGNETLHARLLLSNDANNITVMFEEEVQINHNPPATIEEATVFDVRVVNGGFQVNVTSNLLPLDGTLVFQVVGLANATMNITCPTTGFLQCPTTAVFGDDNSSNVSIAYHIPITQADGNVSYQVSFQTGNITRTTDVTFYITEPTLEALSYVFRPDCFVDVPGENYSAVKYDCIQEEEEFNIRRLTQYLERIKALRNTTAYCSPEQINTTQYIVAGQVDKVIYDEYNVCKDERKLLNDQLTQSADVLHQAESSAGLCQGQLLQNESVALQEAFAYKRDADVMVEQARSYFVGRFWTWTFWQWGVTIIILFSMVWYNNHRREKWAGWN